MVTDRWSMPYVDEILEDLSGGKFFTSLDLLSGYWLIRMDELRKEKTNFRCQYGTLQFEIIPFGLMNAPRSFDE